MNNNNNIIIIIIIIIIIMAAVQEYELEARQLQLHNAWSTSVTWRQSYENMQLFLMPYFGGM
jgi:hypothetical protein